MQFDTLKTEREPHRGMLNERFQSEGIKEINVIIYSQSETQSPIVQNIMRKVEL